MDTTMIRRTPAPAAPTCTYELQRMRGIHYEIIRMAATGMKNRAIAKELGITDNMVSNTLVNPIAQDQVLSLREKRDNAAVDIGKRLAAMAVPASDFIGKVACGNVDNVSPALQLRAAESILDRTNFGRVTKSVNLNLDGKLSEADIADIHSRAIRIGQESGIVDTPPDTHPAVEVT